MILIQIWSDLLLVSVLCITDCLKMYSNSIFVLLAIVTIQEGKSRPIFRLSMRSLCQETITLEQQVLEIIETVVWGSPISSSTYLKHHELSLIWRSKWQVITDDLVRAENAPLPSSLSLELPLCQILLSVWSNENSSCFLQSQVLCRWYQSTTSRTGQGNIGSMSHDTQWLATLGAS